MYHLQTFPTHLPILQKYIIIIHDFLRLAISITFFFSFPPRLAIDYFAGKD